MKVYCGTDIIEVARIEKAIKEHQNKEKNVFLEKVYTEKEIEYCESKGKMKYQHYAVRFAGKEAIFKALSNLLEDKYEISWKNAEIVNDEKGRPKVIFYNISKELEEKIINIDISLSHIKETAISVVVIESEN